MEAVLAAYLKLSARAVQAEETAQALQTELDNQTGKLGSLDTLQSKIEELQSQLTDANSRYDRHNAMAKMDLQIPSCVMPLNGHTIKRCRATKRQRHW